MNRLEGYVFLGFLICVFVTGTFVAWLACHFLGGGTLVWWVAYLVLFTRVAPDERISVRKTFAILIGAPIVVGMVGLGTAGLKGGICGVLPVLLPLGVWLADKLETKIRKRKWQNRE